MMDYRLYRSRTDRMLGGVAGGLARYFAVDPTLVRLTFVLLAIFTGGWAMLIYLLLWMLLPETPLGPVEPASASASPEATSEMAGADPFVGSSAGFGGGSERNQSPSTRASAPPAQIQRRRQWFGWSLIVLGTLALLSNLHLLSWLNLSVTWPAFLILAGLLLLLRQQVRD